MDRRDQNPFARRMRRHRVGAVLSVEWLMALPVLVALMFAITEFSLLWSAKHLLEAATYAAAREASLPAVDDDARMAAARLAAERVLVKEKFINNYEVEEPPTDFGEFTGDQLTVELSLPMKSASPDLLSVIGISISGKKLTARTVMRRE